MFTSPEEIHITTARLSIDVSSVLLLATAYPESPRVS